MNKDHIMQDAINKTHDMAKQFELDGYDYVTLAYAIKDEELSFVNIPYFEKSKDNIYTYLHVHNLTEVFTLDLKNKG